MKQGSSAGPYRKGHWSVEEDIRLIQFVRKYGEGRWSKLAKAAGLQRCGKSCRLRWVNYLRPDIKRGHISEEEERIIIELHSMLGNRWSLIALHLPGRSDNEIKNYWRSHIKKKLKLEDTSIGDNPSGAIDCISSEASQSAEGCDFTMIDKACYNMMGLDGSTNQLENYEHSVDCQNLQEDDYYHLHNALHKFENVLNNETTNLPSLISNYDSISDHNHYTQSLLEDTTKTSTYELISDHEALDMKLLKDHKNKATEGFVYESSYMSTPYNLAQNSIQGVINMPMTNCAENLTCNGTQGESWIFYPTRDSKEPTHNLNPTHCIALSLHDSDVPWDVETIQPIAEAQHTSHVGVDNNYGFELWDNEFLPHVESKLHGGDKK